MKVIILAGGKGTRLPVSAPDIPKALVEVHGKPILAWQLDRLIHAGFRDIRLALGFRADKIVSHLAGHARNVECVVEPQPLGTGGATRFASQGIGGPCMVLNGDTLADFNFPAIVAAHEPGHGLIVSHWRDDARDFGLLELKADRVHRFLEKPKEPQGGHINAGVYILEPSDIAMLPAGFSMLETALLPHLASAGRLKHYPHGGFFDDLGTEERLGKVRSAPPPFII